MPWIDWRENTDTESVCRPSEEVDGVRLRKEERSRKEERAS